MSDMQKLFGAKGPSTVGSLRRLWEGYQRKIETAIWLLQTRRVNPILQRRGWSLLCGNGTYLLRNGAGVPLDHHTLASAEMEQEPPDMDLLELLDLLDSPIDGYPTCVGAEMNDYPRVGAS